LLFRSFPITFVANLQLRTLFVMDLEAKYPFGQILGARLVLSAVAIAVILFTCSIARYSAQSTRVILLVSMALLADCISENYYGVSQRYERMDRIAKSQMLKGFLSLAALIPAVYFSHNLLWGVAGLFVGRILVLLGYDAGTDTFALAVNHSYLPERTAQFTLLRRIRPQWDLRRQINMVWVALPLGTISILISLSANIPRYAIQHYLGQHQLGIYSALNYIPTATLMITVALVYAV